jgi:hypothetical protein
MLEDPTTLEHTALMVNGTKYGDSHQTTSRTQRTTNLLTSKEEEMLKVKQFGLGNHTTVRTNNGTFFISKIRKQIRQKSTEVSRSTNHSLLFQECQ